jgi:hypothetical protein
MATYSTTYRSPSLDDNTKGKYKTFAYIGAGVFLFLVLLLIFWRFFSKLDPKPEPGGLEASFGNVVIAGGGGSPNPTPDPKPEVTNTNTNTSTNVEEVETNDNIKSEAVNTEESPSENNTNSETTNDNSSSSNSSTKSYVPSFGEFGSGEGPGKQGTPDGKKDDLGKVGPGGNGNDGPGGNGDGPLGTKRICSGGRCNCPGIDISEIDFKGLGQVTVYIRVTISPSGDVMKSEIPGKGYFSKNANATEAMKRAALNCAKKYQYDTAGETTVGVIPIVLKQKG